MRQATAHGSPALCLDPEEEFWRHLQHEARIRSVTLARTDARDGPVSYVTLRRGVDLRMHDTEADLILFFRGLK